MERFPGGGSLGMAGLDALDVKMTQYMIAAEKKYRKIKSGRIPFSPEASTWIRRAQVYRSLLRLHAGKIIILAI